MQECVSLSLHKTFLIYCSLQERTPKCLSYTHCPRIKSANCEKIVKKIVLMTISCGLLEIIWKCYTSHNSQCGTVADQHLQSETIMSHNKNCYPISMVLA